MKKSFSQLIGVLVATLLIIFYFMYTKDKFKIEEFIATKEDKIETINGINESITTNYPNTPEDVVDYYCQLLKVIYSKETSQEDIVATVKLMRKMYSDELLELNPEEVQINNLIQDVLIYQETENYLIDSKVEKLVYEADETVNIVMKQVLTHVTVFQNYDLINQDGKWVINRFDIVEEDGVY